jgi:hypothetical protein
MTRSNARGTAHDEEDIAQRERNGETAATSGEHDRAQAATPPGNPEPDAEAVDKGRENLGRVVGR